MVKAAILFDLALDRHWLSYGVQVIVSTSNIATKAGCEQLIREAMKLGPVDGIFNLAVILRDSVSENQDAKMFGECLAPKSVATRHLDEVSRSLCPSLNYFVVFSSASCGRGNAGQSNYGMANSIMERIVEKRHRDGLPGKAVQFGAVGEVGLVAEMLENKIDMVIGGTLQQRISSCLEVLDTLLLIDDPVTSSMIVAEKKQDSLHGKSVIEALMTILSISDIKMVSFNSTLGDLGMDSLMVVEIQQFLQSEYKLDLSAQELRSLTIGQLEKKCYGEDKEKTAAKEEEERARFLNYLMTSIGEEENSDRMIVKLNAVADEKDKVKALIIPGIEGLSGEKWKVIAETLSYSAYILQYANVVEAENVDEIIDAVLNVGDFFLIAT